jgi:hypothetical protein
MFWLRQQQKGRFIFRKSLIRKIIWHESEDALPRDLVYLLDLDGGVIFFLAGALRWDASNFHMKLYRQPSLHMPIAFAY